MDRQLRLLKFGTAEGCFVDGEWGTGKSHLLTAFRQWASSQHFAVAYLNLNGSAAALNHPQRFFHLIASKVAVVGVAGFESIISEVKKSSSQRDKLFEWSLVNRCKSEFATAVQDFVSSDLEHPSLAALAVLSGSDLYWADYGYKRTKALARIEDMGSCLSSIGFGGLVLELDELETLEHLWNSRSRLGAYGVLGTLIKMPHLLPIFATTVRFRNLVESDIERGAIEKCNDSGREFLLGWTKRRYPILKSVQFTRELAHDLVIRVMELYQEAYGALANSPDPKSLVNKWSESPGRNIRTLIRRVVHTCDLLDHRA
jgi:hypothetical protein